MDHQAAWAALNKRIDHGASGCWLWQGVINKGGYGEIELARHSDGQRNTWMAHRLAFFLIHGSLPEHVHHKCHTPACVNPDHLEATTASEHQKKHLKDACRFGHDWSDPENVYIRADGSRFCQACSRERARVRNREAYRAMSFEERQEANRKSSERRRQRKARQRAVAQ